MLYPFLVLIVMDLASNSVNIPAWAYIVYVLVAALFLWINSLSR